MHSSSRRAAHDVRVVVGRLRRRLREVADVDQLTPSQTSALSRVARHGPTSVSALAAAEGVRPQSMAATVGVLEERGLLAKTPDPDDGRRQVLAMTPHAVGLVDGSRRTREEWLAHALDELTEQERQTVVRAMALLERLT